MCAEAVHLPGGHAADDEVLQCHDGNHHRPQPRPCREAVGDVGGLASEVPGDIQHLDGVHERGVWGVCVGCVCVCLCVWCGIAVSLSSFLSNFSLSPSKEW